MTVEMAKLGLVGVAVDMMVVPSVMVAMLLMVLADRIGSPARMCTTLVLVEQQFRAA